ncbi:hypothetical protein V8F06_009986 [Rhypophila decipiens]
MVHHKEPLLLLVLIRLVLAAINLDGSQALLHVSEDDPSPIADTLAYIPDQHDCPLPCSIGFGNIHRWTPFYSVDRLKRCGLPMLLHFSVMLPLDDPKTDVLIRSCSLKSEPKDMKDRTVIEALSTPIENPKNATELFDVSLENAPACAIDGKETEQSLTISSEGASNPNVDASAVLSGIKRVFDTKDNCDETFIFAYHKNTVASIYVGPGLGKKTVASAIDAFAALDPSNLGRTTVAQVCSHGTKAERMFGLAIDATRDLAALQKMAVGWSKGSCALLGRSPQTLAKMKLFDIAAAPLDHAVNGSFSSNLTVTRLSGRNSRSIRRSFNPLTKRATCKYIQVQLEDGCASLASKCGIKGADFMKFNPKSDLSATLKEGDYVCCSSGDPYTPPKPTQPQPGKDGYCATHLIKLGHTCATLATTYGLTVAQIESFNKGKTWGWTDCPGMMGGYNICLSKGDSPLPPPQQGTQCGPLVPQTNWTDRSIPMAQLNPCPLKACCSNWGYCGPFPSHCDIHALAGGGPGTKLAAFESTCISNCGNEIKQNSDGTYTHIHWGFLEIDPATWKPVIKDPYNQWQHFKLLTNVRKIVSFGGWAYSTEPATYNIIRQAIINNRETFATNIANFLAEEKLDGVDIDWEYPGAPDILVNGVPIGQPGDGVAYLRFLTALKSKVGSERTVSIAAPASYWYFKAFPIDRIAAVIDDIVYMTYDLHGQWDYGNVNAYDACPSGKCIRSHVNLTETLNTLSIITKAGVPNNKIFVGEASYGRSFHMAVDGCWGPMCDFTGSRLQSDAQPGRCTDTRGYISLAEINDILRTGEGRQFHDGASNSDILLYQGDYISYMTSTTKDTRRADWEKLNFAGSIDRAVDLQAFGKEDADAPPNAPPTGAEGCVVGSSFNMNAAELCEFTCSWGFCPEPLCHCSMEGPVPPLPNPVSNQDVDLNRLCKFSCKYGFCPSDTCGTPVVDEWDDGSWENSQDDGLWNKGRNFREDMNEWLHTMLACENACWEQIQEAKAEGRTTNYGCIGKYHLDQELPWKGAAQSSNPDMLALMGRCSCDNMLVNFIADQVLEALPIIAQIGCYIVMSTLKLVIDVGAAFIPGVGKAIDAGLDALAMAAQLLAYTYPPDQDPAGAFEWWLSPCGGSDLVPDEIKHVFDIMSSIADGVSSYKKPKNIKPGSGRKGDPANPIDRSKPKAGTGSGPNGLGSGGVTKRRKCNVPAGKRTRIMGRAKNTLRVQSCTGPPGGASTTTKQDHVITSLAFGAKPTTVEATTVEATCKKEWGQACYHYSSAVAQNPAWGTLKCAHGSVSNKEIGRPGVNKWKRQHDKTWRKQKDRDYKGQCDVDEYPPRYFLRDSDPEMVNSGKPGGQLMRFLPDKQNQGAGKMCLGAYFVPHLKEFSGPGKEDDFEDKWKSGKKGPPFVKAGIVQREAEVSVDVLPSFRISKWEHAANPPRDAGMWDNPCWPKKLAPKDPGFTLWSWDTWYNTHTHEHDFSKPV